MVFSLKTALANKPARASFEDALSPADRIKLKIERHALLLRGAPIAAAVSSINAGITVIVAWGWVDPMVIGGWAGAVVALSLFRLVVWRRYAKEHAGAHAGSGRSLLKFTRLHVASMAVNGALWGALAPIFALSGMLSNAYLPFIIAGMSAAAIASAGASWKSVLAFNVPSLAAAAISYGVFAEHDGLMIALVIVLYGVATTYLSYTTQGMIMRSIRLRSRNENLLSAMKLRADAAQEAEQRYRALVESSSDVTLIFSPEGKIVYASPAAEAAFGAPPKNLIGLTTRELVHPDDLDQFRAVGGEALSKELGRVTPMSHVCMRVAPGPYVALAGRLTNMLYVPGVEGFVFSGGRVEEKAAYHAAAAG